MPAGRLTSLTLIITIYKDSYFSCELKKTKKNKKKGKAIWAATTHRGFALMIFPLFRQIYLKEVPLTHPQIPRWCNAAGAGIKRSPLLRMKRYQRFPTSTGQNNHGFACFAF